MKLIRSVWFWLILAAVIAAAACAVAFPENRTAFLAWAAEKLDASAANTFTAILTATVTLVGIYLTNRANTDRSGLQFEHERGTADRARTFDLKRVALLDAAETLQARLALLGGAATTDISEKDIVGQSEAQAATLARAYAVSSEKAFLAIYKAQSEVALAAGGILAGARLRIIAQDVHLKITQQGIDSVRAEKATYLAALRDPGNATNLTGPAATFLQARIDRLTATETVLLDDQQRALRLKFEAHLQTSAEIIEAAKACEASVIDAILAIREDLSVQSQGLHLKAVLLAVNQDRTEKARKLFADVPDAMRRAGMGDVLPDEASPG